MSSKMEARHLFPNDVPLYGEIPLMTGVTTGVSTRTKKTEKVEPRFQIPDPMIEEKEELDQRAVPLFSMIEQRLPDMLDTSRAAAIGISPSAYSKLKKWHGGKTVFGKVAKFLNLDAKALKRAEIKPLAPTATAQSFSLEYYVKHIKTPDKRDVLKSVAKQLFEAEQLESPNRKTLAK